MCLRHTEKRKCNDATHSLLASLNAYICVCVEPGSSVSRWGRRRRLNRAKRHTRWNTGIGRNQVDGANWRKSRKDTAQCIRNFLNSEIIKHPQLATSIALLLHSVSFAKIKRTRFLIRVNVDNERDRDLGGLPSSKLSTIEKFPVEYVFKQLVLSRCDGTSLLNPFRNKSARKLYFSYVFRATFEL